MEKDTIRVIVNVFILSDVLGGVGFAGWLRERAFFLNQEGTFGN